jgi:hypothetical protein
MCAAYAEIELLDFIYLICSLNLTPIVLPECPTHTLLHVLHFNFSYTNYQFETVTVILYYNVNSIL